MTVIVRQPAAAEMVVVIATLAAKLAAPTEIIRVEPQLNPYQPNQRIIVPIHINTHKHTHKHQNTLASI